MRIDLDDVFSALRQLGQTVGDLEMQEKCQETYQKMQENVNPRLVQEKRLKKGAMEPLMEPLEMRELNVQMREMKLEMREILEKERKEMTKKMQEMQEMYQEKYQEMYQEMQELKLKVQLMTKKMQENVNPRTSLDHQITRSEGELQLLFVNELHDAIFTMDKIRDREGEYVKIKLINTASDESAVKKGPLSSMEIEIVVLEGDFGFDGNENWTNEEFNAKIIYTKTGRELPLVKGKVKIKLTDGVGTIEDLSFSDNSNWTGSKKFRLGARAIGMGMGVRIKEARSEAFTVRHHRAKETHLKKIEDGGKFHSALIDNGIHTKSDLKHMYETNPDKLRHEILRDCSNKEWDAFVQHFIRIVDDANSNHLRIPDMQPVVAYNTATTGPPLHQGMQNYSNRASSSQQFCTYQQPENLQEPQVMSTAPTHVRAQFEHSNYIHQPPNNSSWNSFQINDGTWQSHVISTSSGTYHMNDGQDAHLSAAHHPQNAVMSLLNGSSDPGNESNDHGYFENHDEPAYDMMLCCD